MAVKKLFISADIEGTNNIVNWAETELGNPEYNYFREEMTEEVRRACVAAHEAGVEEILIKDAHDSARNLILSKLPEYVKLHRGWQGAPCSMMAGLDETFDAVMFIGYHSASHSDGNPLAHTMTTRIDYIKINGKIASEFEINSMYASYLGVPVAFLSGDLNLTNEVKAINENIETVASKEGCHGAVISKHPSITHKELEEGVKNALSKDLSKNLVPLPDKFEIEIEFRTSQEAYSSSFYPGCKLKGTDKIVFKTKDYYEALRMLKFTY